MYIFKLILGFIFIVTLTNAGLAGTVSLDSLNDLDLLPLDQNDCDIELCQGVTINLSDSPLKLSFSDHHAGIPIFFIEPDFFTFAWSIPPGCSKPGCREVVSIVGFGILFNNRIHVSASFTELVIKEDSMNPFFLTSSAKFENKSRQKLFEPRRDHLPR